MMGFNFFLRIHIQAPKGFLKGAQNKSRDFVDRSCPNFSGWTPQFSFGVRDFFGRGPWGWRGVGSGRTPPGGPYSPSKTTVQSRFIHADSLGEIKTLAALSDSGRLRSYYGNKDEVFF